MRTSAKAAIRLACALVTLGLVGCGRTDRERCEATARPIAACSGGQLSESDLTATCDDPGDGGRSFTCSNEGVVNQQIINCANAVPMAPTQSDCAAFANCLQSAQAVCEH